ncbi:MAG TPA: peptide chain release factor N(5)-glutamine methyltransferase [Terracidiphilus sp.]|nr:peptide chain release factor N(5)-glutamine methyltransferase [Terracidiphilus sp.]
MTLREALEHGAAQLAAGPHPEKARRDAEMLLLHHTGKERAWLLGHLDEDFAGCRAIGYAAMLNRRAAGEPIQYILGECEFYGLPFRVTPDVLIPRPETEHLVERVLTLAQQFQAPRISDIGTGSGAIAVTVARLAPSATITAIDVSAVALAVAHDNAQRNQVGDRIRFLNGDLLVPVAGEQFDVIVSNPPYVPVSDRDSLSVEVRDFEPAVALFAGVDGLEVYRRLIPAAFAALAGGGHLALEIGHGQSDALGKLLKKASFNGIEFTPDLQGILRVVTAQK